MPDVGIDLGAACMRSKRKRTNTANENQFLHFEFHACYGDVLTLKNAEIRGKVLFDSIAEYRFLRS